MLSRESSAEPGPWKTARAPYLRAIMDAFSHPEVEQISVQKPAQVGYTEVLNNIVGFVIDQDPGPTLMVQPNVKPMAEDWSKDRFAPMLRDTACLRSKVKDPRARDSGNTILHKEFPGGTITCVGANSAAGLASRPIRVLLFDEVDRYPASAGTEGDPIKLGEKRATTFHNRKTLKGSTPSYRGSSRIEKSMAEAQRHYYFVPCPACGEMQRMIWRNKALDYCLVFERDDKTGRVVEARYLCQSCGVLIDESEKYRMAAEGEWWHEVETVDENGKQHAVYEPGIVWARHIGFRIDIFYSPWKEWAEIGQDFLEAKSDEEQLKTFVNTDLGDLFDPDKEGKADPESLMARREAFPADVPEGGAILTAGVDVQADRLELEIDAWGAGQECWKTHYRIYGDPVAADVWERLNVFLTKPYTHELGPTLRIRACAIDSGYLTQEVYKFCRGKLRQGLFVTKGSSERSRPILGTPPKKPNRAGVKVFPMGTDTAKDRLFARLKITEPGPGYIHFNTPTDTGGDDEYFAQFAGEVPKWGYDRGQRVKRYKQIRKRNEAIDLGVLNFAALQWLGTSVHDHLDRWVARLAVEAERMQQPDKPAKEAPKKPRRNKGGWVSKW